MTEHPTKRTALAFSATEAASAHELAAELARLGYGLELWQLGDKDWLSERLAAEGEDLHTLLLGLGAGCLDADWLRRFLASAETPTAVPRTARGWVRFAAVEPPTGLAAWSRFDFFGPDREVVPLLEHLEPRDELLVVLAGARSRWRACRDSLLASPRHQNWQQLWSELTELLSAGIETRYRLELRRWPESPEPTWLERLPSFKLGDRDPRRPEWAWFPEFCDRAVHDLRNELAVLPLLAERAGDPNETSDLAPKLGDTLARLEVIFGHALDSSC